MNDESHISLPALQSDLSQQQQVQIHGGRSAARRAMAAGREGVNIVNRYRILIVDDDAVAPVESKVEGLQMYAEDYIVKPFEKEELVARVQRVLRRYGESAGVEQPEVVIDQDLQINFVQHWARVKGQQVTLTPTESKLLFLLVRNAGRVVTNETLLAKAWAGDEEAYEEGLRVHISRLRSKIEPNPSKPVYIQTKRGVGYRFGAKVNYPAGQEPMALAG